MAETLTIRTASSTEVVKIAVPGPQGPKGDKGDPGDVAGLPLSTQGDTLYRGASENQRLPIGTSGQILKVSAGGIPEWANESGAVSSVAGKTGVVTLDKNDVGLGNVTNAAQVTSVTGTAPIVSSGGTTPAISISAATTSAAGSMSSADKTKLNGIAAGAEVNVQANWTEADSGSDAFILNKPATFAPSSHSSSHASSGSDPLAPSDIGAQSIFTSETITLSGDTTLSAARAKIWTVNSFSTNTRTITLPTSAVSGDVAIVRALTILGNVEIVSGSTLATMETGAIQQNYRFVYTSSWALDPITTHGHFASQIISGTLAHERGGLEADVSAYSGLVKISGGSTSAVTVTAAGEALLDDADAAAQRTTLGLGTAATAATGDFAAASHTHELTALAATGATNGHVLTANGSNGVTFAALPASGVTGAASSASDVLGVSGSNITGVDATADRIVYWNNTSNKLAYGTPADAGAAAASHTHAASDITSGTIDTARLASGTANNGTFLRGDQTWAAVSGVTTGSVDNAVLRADGTGGSTSQSSDINVEDATTSTANNVTISNQHSGQTNSSLVLTPKGTGAFIVGPKPDGTTTGGNARGANAVDIQSTRNNANQVASGTRSVVVGSFSRASAQESAAIGYLAAASGLGSVALGQNTASAGYCAALGGQSNTASGSDWSCVAGGLSNTASNNLSFVGGGQENTASGSHAFVAGGLNNLASATRSFACGERSVANRFGMFAHSAGRFAADGDAQRVLAMLRNKTTTNSAVELFLNGSSSRLTVPSGKVMAMLINITGAKSDGSAVAHYVRQYAIKNVGGTTSEVYAAVTVGTDNAAGTSITLSADDTNDAVKIEVAGIASETWRWVASVDAVEIAYGT